VWDAARIEPSDGFKLPARAVADSDLRHSTPEASLWKAIVMHV